MDAPKTRYRVPDILPNLGTDDGKAERRLNEAFALTFATTLGALVLAELRRVSRDRVLMPPHGEGALAYLEGARALCELIDRRVQLGREKKPDV